MNLQTLGLYQGKALDLLIRVIIILLIFFIGRKVIRLITDGMDRMMKRAGRLDAGIRQFLVSVLRAGLYAVLIMVIARRLGISASSIAAVVASCGLAVGLALQGSLQNFAGGVLILTMKPFVAEDYISGAFGEGTVKKIGLVYTTVETLDRRSITVPNGTLANGVVVNLTKNPLRRLDLAFDIGYSADIDAARETILKVCAAQPEVLAEPAAKVFVTSLADSSVKLTLYCFMNISDYRDFLTVRYTLTEQIKKSLAAAGIEIPFPQMDIHVRK